jgi:hypothetical protein
MAMPSDLRLQHEILGSRVEIPDHVVYRSFVAETVILNLNTGKYHGINPSGGYILELLDKLGRVEEAAEAVASEYGLTSEQAADDLCEFCLDLEERGLIVRVSADAD